MGKHRPIAKPWLAKLIKDKTLTTLDFEDSMLLVFLDETGIGEISENHTLFGMGGCVLTGKHYREVQRNWQVIKRDAFDLDPSETFHSKDHLKLESVSDKKLNIVKKFFLDAPFHRVCHFVDEHFISYADEERTWNNAVNVVASALNEAVMVQLGEHVESDMWIVELSDSIARTIETCQIINAMTSIVLYSCPKRRLPVRALLNPPSFGSIRKTPLRLPRLNYRSRSRGRVGIASSGRSDAPVMSDSS